MSGCIVNTLPLLTHSAVHLFAPCCLTSIGDRNSSVGLGDCHICPVQVSGCIVNTLPLLTHSAVHLFAPLLCVHSAQSLSPRFPFHELSFDLTVRLSSLLLCRSPSHRFLPVLMHHSVHPRVLLLLVHYAQHLLCLPPCHSFLLYPLWPHHLVGLALDQPARHPLRSVVSSSYSHHVWVCRTVPVCRIHIHTFLLPLKPADHKTCISNLPLP